jgi:hypothetical protein
MICLNSPKSISPSPSASTLLNTAFTAALSLFWFSTYTRSPAPPYVSSKIGS